MSLIKIAKKQEVIERYLRYKYAPFVSAQYNNAINDKNAAKNAAFLIKRALGRNGIRDLREVAKRAK